MSEFRHRAKKNRPGLIRITGYGLAALGLGLLAACSGSSAAQDDPAPPAPETAAQPAAPEAENQFDLSAILAQSEANREEAEAAREEATLRREEAALRLEAEREATRDLRDFTEEARRRLGDPDDADGPD